MLKAIAKIFAALLILLLALIVWGLIEPRVILDERRETAPIPGLPAEWQDARIALLADFQIGMWFSNEDMIRRAIDRVVEERPAAALVAGDFLYHSFDDEGQPQENPELGPAGRLTLQGQIQETISLVRPLLEAGVPTYAVLGNHDYLQPTRKDASIVQAADELAQALRAAGVTVLRNEAVAMERNGGRLYLGGIDSLYAGRAKVQETLAAIPEGAPRILMMHHPEVFKSLPAGSAPLGVAGHTHGGQVRVPWTPDRSLMALMQSDEVTADGWSSDGYGAQGNRLYVNRGMGFSFVPLRIACPPELTWFTLRKAV